MSFDSVPNNNRKTRSYLEVYKHSVRRQTDMRPQIMLSRRENAREKKEKRFPG